MTSPRSSGLQGICLLAPRFPPQMTGSGVKKGRSHEGPITVQLQPHSATRRLTDLGLRRWTGERRKWHHPTPIWAASYWSIVLAGSVSFGTSPPSALIWQHWQKGAVSDWWLRTSFCESSGGGSLVGWLCFSFLFEIQYPHILLYIPLNYFRSILNIYWCALQQK